MGLNYIFDLYEAFQELWSKPWGNVVIRNENDKILGYVISKSMFDFLERNRAFHTFKEELDGYTNGS